jgi:two-component system phosphate regulon sensor histidine kinase PhoR
LNGIWGRSLTLLALLVLAGIVAWPFFGATAAMGIFSAVLLATFLLHLRNISKLLRWLRNPKPDAVPQAYGIWDEVFAALYRMLRQQRHSETQLAVTLNDFRLASAAMPDGMVILDQSDRIEWCNPKAQQHFGLDRERDSGQQITYLVRHPQFAEKLQSQSYSEPLMLRQARAAALVLSVQIVPYGDRQKLVISRDITELERVETMRRDFVANVSHELRTPLTVLAGFLETLSDVKTPEGGLLARALPLMINQASRMQHLVEDLLTLSRLETSTNPLLDERVNVPRLARSLYQDALSLSAGRHRIALNIESEDWLAGSEHELRSAFSNMLSNAIRYTPDGGEVVITWKRQGDQAAFAVRDSGIGVQPQHIPRLTERFYRVDRSRSRETGGTGLGLAIVKHVLNRHHGWLEIESEPERGSTFIALFPAQRMIAADTAEAMTETV